MLRNTVSHEWIFLFLILTVILYALVFHFFFRAKTAKQIFSPYGEDLLNKIPAYVCLSLAYAIGTGILLYATAVGRPLEVLRADINGYRLSEAGYIAALLAVYFPLRFILTRILYAMCGSLGRFVNLQFFFTKYYLAATPLLVCAGFIFFFYEQYSPQAILTLRYILAAALLVKMLLMLLSAGKILPKNHYLKILYFCTLQIMPVLVLIKALYI